MPAPTDIDAVFERHIKTALGAVSEIVAIIGLNAVTHDPQIYWSVAPEEGVLGPPSDFQPAPPFITYQAQDNGGTELDQMDSSDPRVWGEGLFSVIGRGPLAAKASIETLAALIYQTLHGSEAVYSYPDGDWRIVSTVLETRINTAPEPVEDTLYMSRGGVYRMTAQPV